MMRQNRRDDDDNDDPRGCDDDDDGPIISFVVTCFGRGYFRLRRLFIVVFVIFVVDFFRSRQLLSFRSTLL